MDLSPGQQKALFAAVVVVLVGLGIWLTASPHGSKQPSSAKSPSPTAAASTPAAAGGSPSAVPVPTGSGSVNIYQWLPFSQQALARAAAVTTKVTQDYNTFSYTENAAGYVASMNGLITSQLSQTLKNGYSTFGVAQTRTSQKQISTGTAAIDSIRTFGNGSITFVVTGTQKLASTNGTTTNTNQYAVTVTGQGSSWQVYDIEPASAGNT
ncbi:MAG: hypothetical protein JO016_06195 [Actinobacteria bacterium]|nr:hypothetical protein [Actinomycetota bacterium]